MTKGVKVALAAAAVIFIGSAAASAVLLFHKPDTKKVEIVRDGQILYKLDLEKDRGKWNIPDEKGGYNVVEIYGGEVCVAEADCPDQTCVKMGKLNSDMPIVCLPHKLIVRFAYEDQTVN